MAVDSKQGSNANSPTNGASANGQSRKRKRPSSLLAVASQLPTVESSLEEFIAKANQTLVDPSSWDSAEKQAKQQDSPQRQSGIPEPSATGLV